MSENEKNQTDNQSEETNEFATQLAECQTQVTEWKDRALRTAAEFENFKKRSEKERMMWIMSAQSSMLLDVIAIVDDFDRAFQASDQSRAGFELIYKSLQKILEKYGVQEIKDLTHFDPM